MKQANIIYLFLLLAIAAFSCNGCTLIGLGIGAAIDNVNNHAHDTTATFTQPLFHDANGNTGRFARIQYNDSNVGYATFEDYSDETDSAYRTQWTLFATKHPNSSTIPINIGDSIELNKYSWFNKQAGIFEAYYPEGIYLKVAQNDRHKYLPLTDLDYAGVTGKGNSLDTLKSMYDSSDVPVRAILRFTDQQQKPFTLTNSDFINVKFTHSNAGAIGAAIGAIIDLAIIIELVTNPPKFSFGGNWNWGGGPNFSGGNGIDYIAHK